MYEEKSKSLQISVPFSGGYLLLYFDYMSQIFSTVVFLSNFLVVRKEVPGEPGLLTCPETVPKRPPPSI